MKMAVFDATIDDTFREYAAWELRRHTLTVAGQEDADETVAAEDRMEKVWELLDDNQKRSLKGIGSDLAWVRRDGTAPPRGPKAPDDVGPAEQEGLVAAIGRKDWHLILHYLRLCAPLIPAPAIAQLRGHAYEALGLPAYASVFFEKASDWDAANTDAGAFALSAIERTDPERAHRRAQTIIGHPLHFPPAVVALAAMMVLRRSDGGTGAMDPQRFSKLFSDVVQRLQLEPSEEARAMAFQAVSTGFEIIGDLAAARNCLENGLRLSPKNDMLLAASGAWYYTHGAATERQRTVELFENLARRDGPSILPYFFLAHYHLLNHEFGEALEMSRRAWSRAKSDSVKAQLLEWQAICQTEIGYPPEVVRPLFEKAMSLDPSNPRIAKNLATFDASTDTKEPAWSVEDASMLEDPTKQVGSLEMVGIG
jgi:tetratricopeptide (TPR) repeat protein